MPPIHSKDGLMWMMKTYSTTEPPDPDANGCNQAYCSDCNHRCEIPKGYEFGFCKDCKKTRASLRAWWGRVERLARVWRNDWENGQPARPGPVPPLDPLSDRELFHTLPSNYPLQRTENRLSITWGAVETAARAYYRHNR